jgi:4-amino-4-deoxy-L-arabinose transferase-like glycosyltransferase
VLAAVGLIGVIVVLILFNAAYWPFGIDDAVTIYATFGKQIAQTGQLPRGSLYELYPMLVPLSYAFTHQAAGWIDEHLAALIPAILSVGLIGVAYLLGRELTNRTVGLIAAVLIALTPTTHWASSGYVVACGFFLQAGGAFLCGWHGLAECALVESRPGCRPGQNSVS